MGVSKNMGKNPNHPILIGSSIIFTIHFGGCLTPNFWFNIHTAEEIMKYFIVLVNLGLKPLERTLSPATSSQHKLETQGK